MSSPIYELQQLAVDGGHNISDLLRKAKLVASKLKLDDFHQWIDYELNGYGATEVPNYRKVCAELHLKNPYYGLVPFVVQDREIADMICNIQVRDSVSNLVHLLDNHDSKRSSPIVSLSPNQTALLIQVQGPAALPPVRTIGINQIAGIIGSVRTMILEWALKLEDQGIIGEGIGFSDTEKRKAATSTEINIHNFQGVLGNVSDSELTQNLQMSVTRGDLESLKQYLRGQKINDEDIVELEDALKNDPKPQSEDTFGQRVGNWIAKMVGKAATGAWQVSLSTSSNLLAAGIRAYYGF